MTREEAECVIKNMLDDAEKYGDIDYDNLNDFISACKVAIEALSAETKGDLISREQAIAIATQEGAYDYISAQELAELPSAEPKQKTGKWQKYEGRFDYNWECSECGCSAWEKTDYCAHCGARMEREEE